MQYTFDTAPCRSDTGCTKYDRREAVFGREDVIPLWVADMDFPAAQPILEAIAARAAHPIYGYTTYPTDFFASMSNWQSRRHHWTIDPQRMSFAPGVVPALSALIECLTKKGDGILVQTPVYAEFFHVIAARGRKVLENPLIPHTNGQYTLDLMDFEQKIRKSSLFILCSPHNPVGRVWTHQELSCMGEICLAHNVPMISDEIHSDLIMPGHRHTPTMTLETKIAENTIACLSATKTFNLAGLHASAVVFPQQKWQISFECFWDKLRINRPNCFAAAAMEAALLYGEEWLDQLIPYLAANMAFVRDALADRIPQIKTYVPQGTYLMWLDCRDLGFSQKNLVDFMVNKAGIGLNDGDTFHPATSGFMRLNAACPRGLLEQALNQLEKAVRQLFAP